MNQKAKKILMGSGIAAAGLAAFTAVSCKLTGKLVNVALDREQPKATQKSKKILSGSQKTEDPWEQELSEASERLKTATVKPWKSSVMTA